SKVYLITQGKCCGRKQKRINIYMNVELNDSLKIQAVKEHSSVSEILSKLAKEYLEKNKIALTSYRVELISPH
ncbi:ribbon-helix-helix domain-containing protein, partial [Ligilactobacillus equi]|uniref:ribbon-helix-helix domain-containing protein n=1 Tax=Ligilactobacillus equi TaxID=137357 RepID=UPI0012DE5F60